MNCQGFEQRTHIMCCFWIMCKDDAHGMLLSKKHKSLSLLSFIQFVDFLHRRCFIWQEYILLHNTDYNNRTATGNKFSLAMTMLTWVQYLAPWLFISSCGENDFYLWLVMHTTNKGSGLQELTEKMNNGQPTHLFLSTGLII